MDFETKIVIILRDNLEVWQKLNITAFLMSGISGAENIIGEEYIDADGQKYLSMCKQPIMIFASETYKLREILKKSFNKEIKVSVYTEELFNTYNDMDNRNMVARYKTDDLNLVGIGIIGKKNHISKLTKGLNLHS